jgi:hypothetical protein
VNVNRPGKGRLDPFDLRRIGVGFTDSPGLLRARMALYLAFGSSIL